MELLGHFIVFILSVGLQNARKLTPQAFISEFVDSAAGGAVEEIMEALIKKLFPDGSFYLIRKMNTKKTSFNRIKEHLQNLNSSEQNELVEFLKNVDYSKASKKKFDSVMEILGGDRTEFYNNLRNLSDKDADEKRAKLNKAVDEVCKDIRQRTDQQITNDLDNVDIRQIVKDLFGVEWKDLTPSVQEFFNLINKQIYELKYLNMSAENKDLVKVFQYMIKEQNADLLEELQHSFQYITKTTDGRRESFKEIKIDSLAKTNPFCYFRLECPDCKASGNDVYKDKDNNIHCNACGKVFSIIQAIDDDEIKDLLEKETKKLLDSNERQTDDITKQLEQYAGKIIEEACLNTSNIAESIKNQGKVITAELKDAIDKKIDEAINQLRDQNITSNEALSAKIDELIKEQNHKICNWFSELYTLEKDTNDIAHKNHKISQDISNKLDNIQNADSTEETLEQITCPFCSHSVRFLKKRNDNYCVCPICNCILDENRTPITTINNLELVKRRGSFAITSDSYVETEIARLIISPEIANLLGDKNNESAFFGNQLSEASTLIISAKSDSVISERALARIIMDYDNIRTIVFSGSAQPMTNDRGEFYFSRFLSEPKWDYLPELHKLTKPN